MAGKRRRLIEGFKFVCSSVGKPCTQCAAHCGHEYVHEPQAGQYPIEERPDPPLHINCRCTLELISNTLYFISESGPGEQANADIHGVSLTNPWEVYFTTPGLSEYFNTGRIGRFGLVYCTDGRDESDGPTYGNFGGQRWRYGRNEDKISELASEEGLTVDEWLAQNYKPSIDSLDSTFEDHDYCYGEVDGQYFYSQSKIECDKQIIEVIRNLDEDPSKWPNPPRNEEEIEYARKFRDHALTYFEAKVDYAVVRDKYGDKYMKINYPGLCLFLEMD